MITVLKFCPPRAKFELITLTQLIIAKKHESIKVQLSQFILFKKLINILSFSLVIAIISISNNTAELSIYDFLLINNPIMQSQSPSSESP